MITFAVLFITWCRYSSWISGFGKPVSHVSQHGTRDHIQEDDEYCFDRNTVQTSDETIEKDTVFPFSLFNWLNWFFWYCDASLSLLLTLLPPPTFLAVGFHPAFEYKYRAGQCMWCVCLFVGEQWGKKRVVRMRPLTGSHLCLQVHDLLTHQRNGGAGLLPLHRLQLQRRGCHCLQVLPHPGGGGVGLPDALPRPLTRGLLLVLMRGGYSEKACLS